MNNKTKTGGAMLSLAAFIVDKRKGFFLFYIVAAIFCVFSRSWVSVNNDITTYLPEETETRQGITLMNDEFVTYGTASVMLDNVSAEQAEEVASELDKIDGITSAEFDRTADHYHDCSALISVTFDGEETDDISVSAMNQAKELLSGYDVYISSSVGSSTSETIASEIQVVMLIAVIIIVTVLLFTSQTYAEVPVQLMTFGMAALLNMGTNFIFGEISFVSNSIAVVLQLALAIDYAIILCNRFTEEHKTLDARDAAVVALSKAIPEISSSSLTTIAGLVAMMFMQFRLGLDLGLVLIKAIFLSLLCVFTLMPGLLVLFSGLIEKSHHKSFMPDVTPLGWFSLKTRYIVPPIFAVLLVAGCILSNNCNYAYGYSTLTTTRKNESQIAEEKIEDAFGSKNLLAIIVPSGDYVKEGRLLDELDTLEITYSTLGLANIQATDDYVLTDELTPRQFAELTDLDVEVAQILYSAYAAGDQNYGRIISGIDTYKVPLIDMFDYLYRQKEAGYVTLDDDLNDELDDLNTQLTAAKAQLKSGDYSRMLLYTNLPAEGQETFDWLDRIHEIISKYYTEDTYLVGDSTSNRDLSASFVTDNTKISVISALLVTAILVFTFKSAGLPVLLMLIIQGSIWLNFSFPTLSGSNLFFLSFLIVSSIQMGANIDYAIVISSRYTDLKKTMDIKEAVVKTINAAFPTIITSGTILASAGLLIGFLSSDPAISSIGTCLGRGTIISIVLVIFVLPQILVLGDSIIEKSSFTIKRTERKTQKNGVIRVDGRLRGYVCGVVDANMTGVIKGEVNAMLDTGNTPKNNGDAEKDGDGESDV